MTPPNEKSPDDRRIDLEAARWLVKRDRGLRASEQDEYLEWLTADPRHAEWMARHEQTWAEFDHLVQWKPEHSADANPDVLAPAKRPRPAWRIPALVLAAACVALWFGIGPHGSNPAALGTNGEHRTWVSHEYERRTLPDGSVVELNGDTVLELHFTAAERRVTLARGEAHFTVVKNPARPFVVTAHDIGVRAVGTAFNVRLAPDAVDVLVTEGVVKLEAPGGVGASEAMAPRLAARDRAIVPRQHGAAPQFSVVTDEEKARLLGWQPEFLEFDSAPLASVVRQFNRRNRVQLVLADEGLAQMPIVASFRSDNVEGFVRLLAVTAGVQVERREGVIQLRRKAE